METKELYELVVAAKTPKDVFELLQKFEAHKAAKDYAQVRRLQRLAYDQYRRSPTLIKEHPERAKWTDQEFDELFNVTSYAEFG